ncbi:MAG: dephospho-CoA kinase [Gammaproteobacteria bacterium]|nr:dephospho-CoA kinase [Gammaproteobacteria bacterium]
MASWVVVLTGGIGSGKSLVANRFEEKGIAIVEQDDLSREIVEPGQPALEAIAERFGIEILDEQGALRRGELRQRIFENPEHRKWLNQLTHPLINQLTRQRVQEAKSTYVMVVNPLLGGRSEIYDRVLVVDTPVETQIKRTMQRDNISEALAQEMVKSQVPRDYRLKLADDIIHNDGRIEKVQSQIDSLHRRYLFMSIP